MDISSIIAGVFGGFLGTIIVNYLTKSLDFKYDYKKYILEKRKTAYDVVEKVMADLFKEETDSQLSTFRAIFVNAGWFWGTKKGLHNLIIIYRAWLSNEILEKLNAINVIMEGIAIDYETGPPEWDQKFIDSVLKDYQKPINDETEKLFHIFFNDIRNLDNINEFKNNKLGNSLALYHPF